MIKRKAKFFGNFFGPNPKIIENCMIYAPLLKAQVPTISKIYLSLKSDV